MVHGMKTVLIADDEYTNYLYLSELIKNTDASVLYASNGLEAVDLFKGNTSIVLVLMDIRMPILNGFLATKWMKDLRPEVPVFAQTAYALESDLKNLESRFDGYFIKPIHREDFIEKLSKYINFNNH